MRWPSRTTGIRRVDWRNNNWLWGWCFVSAINAAHVGFEMDQQGTGTHGAIYEFGYGATVAIGLWVAGRFMRRPWMTWTSGGLLAVAAAFYALPEDLDGLASRIVSTESALVVATRILVVLGALTVLVATAIGRLARRHLLTRLAALLVATGVTLAQHHILLSGYPGIHLFAVLGAACLASGALPATPFSRTRAKIALVLSCGIAIGSLTLSPSHRTRSTLQNVAGAAHGPWAFRMVREVSAAWSDQVALPLDPWFRPRTNVAPIPPSHPSLVAEQPIVLMFSIDALRADVLERFPDRFPTLTQLRRNGVYFTNARSTSPGTRDTLASVFSGKHRSQLHWARTPGQSDQREWPAEDPTVRFPELLSQAEINTVHVSGLDWFRNEIGVMRGFEDYSYVRRFARSRHLRPVIEQKIREHSDRGATLLYTHFLDAHAPYNLAGRHGEPFERFVREVQLVDTTIGQIRGLIEELGLTERTAWIIFADHGEEFGEHGGQFHNRNVYDVLLRVPLLIVVPNVTPREVAGPVSTIDIGPTVLDLFGQRTPGDFMGQSLVPFLRGETPNLSRPIVAETPGHRAMLFEDGGKIILTLHSGVLEYYNLHSDPGEIHNSYEEDDPRFDDALIRLRAFFQAHEY